MQVAGSAGVSNVLLLRQLVEVHELPSVAGEFVHDATAASGGATVVQIVLVQLFVSARVMGVQV